MSRIVTWTKETAIPISLGLLFMLVAGVFALAMRIAGWERKLDEAVSNRWTYSMEKDSWHEFARSNPDIKVPNIQAIKTDNGHN
jgi:hypothetical protein